MYLKSLEIQGFKSFPDKTELKFNKGITAVVGPNGSGKSNISDAMKWVMGEQSTKAMRDDKMSGVIFHGTQSRPKSQFAQVTMNIANDDKALDFDSDIVSVSRKLYQNGDSEYMINGKAVRLKDVVELFMDTGLGRDGYSIIGQGRIADIVNGKSNDRREIFEEAAGIAKFRLKKEEAEKKLTAAEENISRLNDIIGELEGRIGPLKKQAEKAKQFRIFDDEKRELEISVWNYKLNKYLEELNGYKNKLDALNTQYQQLSDELADSDKEILESSQKSAECIDKINAYNEEIHNIEAENSKANSDIAVFENDISHLENNILQLREQIEQTRSSRYFNETELKKQISDLAILNQSKTDAENAISEKENEFNRLINESENTDKSVNDVNLEINKVYLKKNEMCFKLENAKNTISEVEEQLESILETQNELENNSRLARKELSELRSAKGKAEEKREEFNNKLTGLSKLYESKSQKLSAINENLSKSQMKQHDFEAKLHILQDLENSMEGFAYSVKNVLKAGKQGRIGGICGSVAQLITVQSEHSVAVETALGGALQNVVVENEDTAKRCIGFLKENKSGRATFLPLTSVKGTRLDVKSLENENGFIALGCDIVKADSRFDGIIKSLLGRICIAENIDLGSVIAKKYGYKFRIVTLDGQVINAGGSYTGGSVSKNTGILTRKNEIEEINNNKLKLEQLIKEQTEEREILSQETAKFSADIEGIKEQLNVLNNDCVRFESEIKRVNEFNLTYEKQLDDADLTVEQLKKKLVDTQNDIDNAEKGIVSVDKEILECEAKLTVSQTEQAKIKEKRENLNSELSSLRIHATEINKDIEACKLSIEQLKNVIENNSGENGKLSQQIIETEGTIKQKKQDIEDIHIKLSGSSDEIQKINNLISKTQREHLEYDKSANQLRNLLRNKMEEKETLSSEITRTEERKQTVANNFDKLVAQLWDDYELTRTDAAEKAVELDSIEEADRRLAELRGKIKSLGNVNVGAIEEYAEVSERYEFLNGQLGDVNKSKKELEDMIDQLTENMKSMFMQTFDIINSNFKKVFSELFGGGTADLVLTDSENVLECGIDIHAQPPGKVITNLLSLSGGEQALVAVSIYFAILKHSPSPFCLLDEIEAALDDSNVSKYAQYLHRLTDKTQFIAITHRRGTMEEADMLYGVTMQEKGISRLLAMTSEDTRQMKLDD